MKSISFLFLGSALLFLSCKSAPERQGDKHLKDANFFQALKRYNLVLKSGKGSKDFESNLTKAYIGAMESTAHKSLNDVDRILEYIEVIDNLMLKSPNPENQTLYGNASAKIGILLIEKKSDYQSLDLGFKLLQKAFQTPGLSPDLKTSLEKAKSNFYTLRINKANKLLAVAQGGDINSGIEADYTLTEAEHLAGPDPVLESVFSQVRKQNLSTYLMYDIESLALNPHPAINKYGVLLAILNISRQGGTARLQMKAFNGASNHISFKEGTFSLTTKQGNTYKAIQVSHAFASTAPLLSGNQSEVGLTSFAIPAGEELGFIKFEYGAGQTIKYFP